MHGGKREGAGRKRGSASKKTREIADKAAEEGITPLEYLLSVMRNAVNEQDTRIEAAKAAAPYIHPRLATVNTTLNGELSLTEKRPEEMTDEELAAIASRSSKGAA